MPTQLHIAPRLPSSLRNRLADAGLTMDDWDAFEDVMTSGTDTEQAQYNCWMRRYISGCVVCPACNGPDPFAR